MSESADHPGPESVLSSCRETQVLAFRGMSSHHPTLGCRLTVHKVRLAAEPMVSRASMQPLIGPERASRGCLWACTIRGSCAATQASTPGLLVSVAA